jgi:hypothetical protein
LSPTERPISRPPALPTNAEQSSGAHNAAGGMLTLLSTLRADHAKQAEAAADFDNISPIKREVFCVLL